MPTIADSQRCPECQEALKANARACACGWKRPKAGSGADRPTIPCAFEGCPDRAILRRRVGPETPGKERHNWSNLCAKHDMVVANQEAADFMKSNGLERKPEESRKDWHRRTMDWIKQRAAAKPRIPGVRRASDLLVSRPQRQREPGEDWEEDEVRTA